MSKARYLYSELASLIAARRNCEQLIHCERNESHAKWFNKHTNRINELVREHMPCGSGFDAGTKIDLDASHAAKLVFTTSYHHMHESGMYDGWTEHTVTVTPSFRGYNLRVSGRDRNQIKDYIHEEFDYALMTEIDITIS